MLVRMKMGAYAGEVREVTFEAARSLVESGNAEDVFEQLLNSPRPRADQAEAVIVGADVSPHEDLGVPVIPAHIVEPPAAAKDRLLSKIRKKR